MQTHKPFDRRTLSGLPPGGGELREQISGKDLVFAATMAHLPPAGTGHGDFGRQVSCDVSGESSAILLAAY